MAMPTDGYTPTKITYTILRDAGFSGAIILNAEHNGPVDYDAELEAAMTGLADVIKTANPGEVITVERNYSGALSQGTVYTA